MELDMDYLLYKKKMKKQLILLTLFVCFTGYCSFGQSERAIAKIDSIRIKMQKHAKNNEFHKVADFYTANAVVNGFDGSYSGTDEIKDYWKNIRGKGVDWEWANLDYSGNENYVTQTGTSLLTLQYGERVVTYSSLFSVVWEKQSDGNYKITSDFYRPKEELNASFEVETDSVWIITETDSIFGVLFRPLNKEIAKSPAILCLQGGGDVGLANYFLEARYFAENGIVALVCDKAGAGQSKGKSSWVTQTFEDKTNEYFQVVKWLKNQPFVDAQKVGVHGLSEGGRLALNLAIKYPNEIAFVNAVSAPIESFKENQLFAIYNLLYERNFDFSTITETINIWNEYFDGIATGKINPSTIKKANVLREKVTGLYLPPNSTELPQRPQSKDINYSLENINEISCPVLFQFGMQDTRVNSLKSISLIGKASNFQITHYSETDHAMNQSNGDLNENYLKDKYEWLKRNALCQ